MAGENKREWTERLDPVVDLGLAWLGLLTLGLFANQLLLLLHRYFPVVRIGLLTLLSGLAVVIGMAGRKMRRGQYDLPRLIRLLELGLTGAITAGVCFYYPLTALVLSVLIVLVLEELGFELAHHGEDLLFDFTELKGKANWENKWETEGFRLYDRHISGYRKLQQMMLGLDLILVVIWLLLQKPGFWGVTGGGLFFLCQFLFLGVGFYQKKRIFWAIQGYDVDKHVFQRMVGLVLILAVGFSTVAMILPVNYNPVPWKAFGNLLNSLFSGKVLDREFTLPESEEVAQVEEERSLSENRVMDMGSSWQILLYFILVGVVVLFFLVIFFGYLLSLLGDERYRLQGLPALMYRMYRFFREMLRAWWNGLRDRIQQVRIDWEHHREERMRKKLAERLESSGNAVVRDWLPRNRREEIVKYFVDMINFLAAKGIQKRGNQTLAEYILMVREQVPTVAKEFGQMQGLVEEALYSLHDIGHDKVEMMCGLVQIVHEQIKTTLE